jgi:hypothetical protein
MPDAQAAPSIKEITSIVSTFSLLPYPFSQLPDKAP